MTLKQNIKPSIFGIKNGPLIIQGIDRIIVRAGKNIDIKENIRICRCGRSKKYPLCDGGHKKADFRDEKASDCFPERTFNYKNKKITVHYIKSICNHNGACLRSLPYVFNVTQIPWINVDNASPNSIIKAIKKCLTGALSYSIDKKKYKSFNLKQGIVIEKDGPIIVTGGIKFEDERENKAFTEDHYILCGCGNSKNMPFCDGEHYFSFFNNLK